MKYLLIALTTLITASAFADDAFISLGVGAANSAKNSAGEVKIANVGYRRHFGNGFYWQAKLGYFGDGSGDPTRKSSGYASTGPGALIDLHPIEMRIGYGLAAITTPDSYLGARMPQFQGEVYIGVRDPHGKGLGAQYEHISCASFCTPNQGRDFLVIQLSQSF